MAHRKHNRERIDPIFKMNTTEVSCNRAGTTQARRKHFGSGAAIGTKKTAGGVGGAVSPPAGPGQSPGGGPGGEAPGSSVNLGILKP